MFEMLYPGCERVVGLQIFQIADVMADETVVIARQAEGVLHLRAAGENLSMKAEGGFERHWRITARTAEECFSSCLHARDRIVYADPNAPVVPQKVIGNLAQSPPGFAIFVTDRLV